MNLTTSDSATEELWREVFISVTSLGIAAGYLAIVVGLLVLARRWRRWGNHQVTLVLFAALFAFGAATHVFIAVPGKDFAFIEILLRVLMAATSGAVAVAFWRALPRLQRMPVIRQLESEVRQRRQAQEELARVNAELEERIAERTRALEDSNAALRETATHLEEYQGRLEQLVAKRTQELIQSEVQLRQSERLSSLGVLAAGIAHEINNPIGGIVLACENALETEREMTDEERKTLLTETCKRVMDRAERCGSIVRGVLQFSRKRASEKRPIDMRRAIEGTLDLMRTVLSRRNARVAVHVQPGPAPVIWGNSVEVDQIIVNLVRNALEASEPGVSIRVEVRSNEHRVEVSISDDGPGIPEDIKPHIFDPFFTTRQSRGGTGLGLSIVHGIVSDHGGSIHVLSTQGRGTTVELSFPRVEEQTSVEADGAAAMFLHRSAGLP